MGIDVYGLKPTSEIGEYFRSDFEGWWPLATYVQEVAPDITKHCRCWQTNDGEGLGANDANQLANRLQKELDTGRTLLYQRRFTWHLEAMPNVSCWLCDGTGTGKPFPGAGAGNPKTDGIKCNMCEGSGFTRPYDPAYRRFVRRVAAFTAFLRECGGFSIW
jgi:hypothetical protein